MPAIIRRAKDQCNLVWLENLNLRGGYKKTILDYIATRYPSLAPLYEAIYVRGDRGYWAALDEEIRAFAAANGLPYVRDDGLHPPPLRDPAAGGQLLLPRADHPLRQACAGKAKCPKLKNTPAPAHLHGTPALSQRPMAPAM